MRKKGKKNEGKKEKKEKKKNVVLFIDFDGTLVDSIKAHHKSFNLTFREANIKEIDFKTFSNLFGFFSEEIIRRHLEKLKIKKSQKEIEKLATRKKEIFLKKGFYYVKPYPKVNATLKKLSKYYLILETNASLQEVEKIANFANLKLDYFDLILSKEKIKHRKPNPELIKKALKIINLKSKKPTIVVVGDTFVDVLLANNAKAVGILITKNPKLEIKKCEMLNQKCKPDFVIKHFYELPRLIEEFFKKFKI